MNKQHQHYLHISTFYPTSGGFFNIKCADYGKEVYESHGWVDALSLSMGSEKLKKFLLGDPF